MLVLGLVVGAVVALAAVRAGGRVRSRRPFGTTAQRATYAALHEVSVAAPHLRAGLTENAATASVGHLRALLGAPAVSLVDVDRLLAWHGEGEHHADAARALADAALTTGRSSVAHPSCADPDCPVRAAVVAPLLVEDRVVGALTAYAPSGSASLVRAVGEVAR